MRHIISILLENEAGALSRVVGLFSARGYNIEALTVAPTEDESLSRVTILTIGDDRVVEQIIKQIGKLIEVVNVSDLNQSAHIERELMLIKLKTLNHQDKAEIKRLTDIFRGRIVDVHEEIYTIELTGDTKKIEAFIESTPANTIVEVVRTGLTGIGRGNAILSATRPTGIEIN